MKEYSMFQCFKVTNRAELFHLIMYCDEQLVFDKFAKLDEIYYTSVSITLNVFKYSSEVYVNKATAQH